jgi:MarR family transcriptional regulator, organic hydroperoxide resistance regulator
MRSRRSATTDKSRRRFSDPCGRAFRIANYPFYRIARVNNLYADCLDRALKPRGMDQPRWRVLMILSEHNPAAMGLIAEMAVMKLPTVVKLVRRMVDEGLVRSSPRARDRRVTDVTITAAGRRALVVVKRAASVVYTHAAANLRDTQLAALNATLRQIEISLQGIKVAKRRSVARGKRS